MEKFIENQDKKVTKFSFKIIELLKGETFENIELMLKNTNELAKKACVNTVKETF